VVGGGATGRRRDRVGEARIGTQRFWRWPGGPSPGSRFEFVRNGGPNCHGL